jgi:hypothetical protein
MEDLRYPIGTFKNPANPSLDDIHHAIDRIAECPRGLRAAVAGLSDAQLDTPYRDGGWTARQVVHHVPDSHMNAYIRSKLCVDENHPRITAYNEAHWANFADAQKTPIPPSLAILENLHERWVVFLRSLPESAFKRTLDHPENGAMTLAHVVFMYAWHGEHHTAHITSLRDRKGWK